MKFFRIPTKVCTGLFFLSCLAFCALLAWRFGAAHASELIWVAREKIVGAPATIPVEQFSAVKALAAGAPVFLLGALCSLPLAELFCAVLAYFRREI